MVQDYWETQVYAAEPLASAERVDEGHLIRWIEDTFPFAGSKIAWDSVQGRHTHHHIAEDDRLARVACREIVRLMRTSSGAEHVGDSLSPFAVRFGYQQAEVMVPALLEIPEHHYFVDEGRSWLVVVTMTNYLDILRLPPGD